ncbi:MAG: zinc-binding dehydrogenase [Elusimicrobia bacterium]|nr:zinc-binding dehydrogenase [Elusimicrobiota bacterium]MDE2425875.1 zinc-binding dehydrogenase [Elusimicrobiota bacterium]
MKAVIVKAWGGVENLAPAEVPDPKPGPGEALIRVRACALNHLDLWVRRGLPVYKIKLPHVLGSDVSGEIVETGAGVSGFKAGDRVIVAPGRSCWRCQDCLSGRDNLCRDYGILGQRGGWGGYAELLAVPQRYLLALPEGLSFEQAAAFPLTFLTAWHMLMSLGGCGPDQWVLVVGAGSGVGVAAIQIAKLAGARALAASTSREKLEKARALGADAGVLLPKEDLAARAKELTGGAGVDIAFEHVGPATFASSLKSLRPGGRLVTCGASSGATVELDLRYVFSRHYRILGSTMGTLAELRRVTRLAGEGRLKPVIDRSFPLEQARQAQEYLEQGRQFGKVLLIP